MKIIDIAGGRKDNGVMRTAAERLRKERRPIDLINVDSETVDLDEKRFLELLKDVKTADMVLVHFHGEPSRFKKFDRLKEVLSRSGRPAYIGNDSMPEVMLEHRPLFTLPDEEYDRIRAYIEVGGEDNYRSFLLWACKTWGKDASIVVPEPVRPEAQGIYHPDIGKSVDLGQYLSRLDPSRPTVGILFSQGSWLSGSLEPIDSLIRAVGRTGANTLPVFFTSSPSELTGSIGVKGAITRYLMDGDSSRADAVIMNMGFSQLPLADPGTGERCGPVYNFFRDLDVPVLQAMTLWKSQANYEKDVLGLNAMEISVNVVGPEFDGQLITIPFAFTETVDGVQISRSLPERVERVAAMAKGYADLRRTPPEKRRVAILMYAPGNDRIGTAAGLDTFQSIADILKEMKEAGYTLDHVPADGEELLDEIMAGVTNDTEWLSPQEIKERAADSVAEEQYRQWFDAIPVQAQEAICRNWGEPPGTVSNIEGRLMMPGVRNGNLFIGLQPLRGLREQAETLYHSTDVVMPHQYLAYYRWLKEGFGAQVIVHMGTHGTLEWLPGKSVGLSEKCYPDIVLGSIPNLYPYIIHNPGEGTGAKRRSFATLVDHLIPAMARAESYDELMELEGNLQSYFHAVNAEQRDQMAILLQKVHSLMTDLNMFQEIGLRSDASPPELESHLNDLYDHISELKDALIRDGLHVMGRPPEGQRLEEMLYCLTRLQNGSVPSLRAAVAEARGLDLRELQDNPSQVHPALGELNGALLDEVDGQCHELISKMMAAGFAREKGVEAAIAAFPKNNGRLIEIVSYLCDQVYPNVMATTDEVRNLLHGLEGGYVPPGPSGSPTRGNAHLLPTGRNFYTLDPDSIPSPASWEIGKKMADQMVERHVKEMGCYPKSVGIVIWAIDTMRTGGDDIAYILWLMGLRPKWSATGGRVIGLEVIPLNELGRPRIDVTTRISGLFRDTFYNLVDMIDEGVETIASLDESEEENFIVKHLREDIQRSIREGLSPTEARARAMVRVFGDPPGGYGYGIDNLIESSKWSTTKDLADTYVTWGCHAYGRAWKGEKLPDSFQRRICSMDVTVKNHEDREFDLLDIDDDYGYLGGMNSVIREYADRKPLSIMGDSSDPQRLRTRTLEEESKFVFRSRVLNPKWLEGLKQHGYRGAMELSYLTEYVLGWDATSDIIEPWMYESLTEHFLLDEENRKWIEESNPYALREMASRLLEAIERGLWDASEEMKEKLSQIFLDAESVLEEANEER